MSENNWKRALQREQTDKIEQYVSNEHKFVLKQIMSQYGKSG